MSRFNYKDRLVIMCLFLLVCCIVAAFSVVTAFWMQLQFKPDLVIVTESAERMYDGVFFSHEGFEAYGLHSEHRIEITDYASYRDAGVFMNSYSRLTVYDGDGRDVTGNYNITAVFGEIIINPAPVTFVSDTYTVAVGAPPSDGCVISRGSLQKDEYYTSTFNVDTNSVGAFENNFTVKIFRNENGRVTDITHNYTVTTEYGHITVNPQ